MIKYQASIRDLLLSLLITLIVIRNNFFGYFFGDPMDSKLQITIQDHWYKWFIGKENFFDLGMFYPEQNTLGYSDTLIIPGVLHVILRLIGLDAIYSWQFSNIIILFFGIIILFIFTKKIIKNWISSWVVIFLFLTSHTLLENLSGQPNTVNYLLFFVIPICVINLANLEKSKLSVLINTIILLIFIPLFALSTWYAFFLGLIYSIIFLIFFLILDQKEFINFILNIYINFKKLNFTSFTLVIAISLFIWTLFIFTYFDISQSANNLWIEVSRTETDVYSIIRSFILNSFFVPLDIRNRFLPNSNYYPIDLGSGPIIFFILVTMIIIISRKKLSKFFIVFYLSTVSYFLFFIPFQEYSLFRIFWNNITLFESIRYTYRANIFVGFFLILIGVWAISNIFKKSMMYYSLLIITLFVSINQWQEPPSKWKFSDYFNNEYEFITNKLNESACESFVVDTPGKGWWDDQLTGLQIMRDTSIRTLNGYSGDYPPNYFATDWSKDSQLLQIGRWLNEKKGNQDFCRITPTSIQIMNSSIGLVHDKNFDVLEFNNNSQVWSWSLSNTSYLRILNFNSESQDFNFSFRVKLPNCSKSFADIKISPDNSKIIKLQINNKNQLVDIEYEIPGFSERFIKLVTDFEGCTVETDSRKLFYQVQFG